MTVYLIFPLFLLISLHMQRIQVAVYPVRFAVSTLMSASVVAIILGHALVTGSAFDFRFIYGPEFYLNLAVMVSLIVVQMECRKVFASNLPLLNFSGFLCLASVPLVSIAATHFLGFDDTLELDFRVPFGLGWLVGLTTVLTCLYYAGKIKSEGLAPGKLMLLALHTLLASCSIVMAVKMIQQFDPLSLLLACNLSLVVIFGLCSFCRKESALVNICTYRSPAGKMIGNYILGQGLGMMIMTAMPVEEFNMLRTVGMVVIGYAFFYVLEQRCLFTRRDLWLLAAMVLVQFLLAG